MMSLLVSLCLCKQIPLAVRDAILLRTWYAVCLVESGGDPRAVNLAEGAVGIAQIRPIVVADCNRIMGRAKWTLHDRLDPLKSLEMFRLYVRYYAPAGGPEQWARIWVGGPERATQRCTLAYWGKVRAEMERR